MSGELKQFRRMVNERGERLRKLPFQTLKQTILEPERITIGRRQGTIAVIVDSRLSGGVIVVVQGFMDGRLLPFLKDVALDGFYKYPDETIAPLTQQDMWDYS